MKRILVPPSGHESHEAIVPQVGNRVSTTA
jgi:hypothetical protein